MILSLSFFYSFTLFRVSLRFVEIIFYFYFFYRESKFLVLLTFLFLSFFSFWHLPDELLHFDLFLNARVGDIYNPETTQLMDRNRKLKFCLKRGEQYE